MEPGIATGRLDLGLTERFQRLRNELGVESFGLNLMHLAPGQGGRVHRHKHQEEVYIVLEGTLTVEVEGGEMHELSRGAVARLAPDLRRQLSNRATEPVRFLAIGGGTPHEGRDALAYDHWGESEGRPPQEVSPPEDFPHG